MNVSVNLFAQLSAVFQSLLFSRAQAHTCPVSSINIHSKLYLFFGREEVMAKNEVEDEEESPPTLTGKSGNVFQNPSLHGCTALLPSSKAATYACFHYCISNGCLFYWRD